MHVSRRFAHAMTCCAAAGSLALAPAVASPSTAQPAAETPSIAWGECPKSWRAPYRTDCGTMSAPLDYSDPDGEQITVAMARYPATDPENKIGTLFYNPGGPGDSGIRRLRTVTKYLVNPVIRERFDIVGIDPRGVGATEPFECFDVFGAGGSRMEKPLIDTQPGEAATLLRGQREFRADCAKSNPRIGRFMSTADNARDLDRAREAVGDDALTFIGTSYGTYLGTTYANLFGDRVRAIVTESGVDPTAWATGEGTSALHAPAFARLGSVHGARAAIDALIEDCAAAGEACSPHGDFADDWKYVHEEFPSRDLAWGQYTTYDDFIRSVVSAMYTPSGMEYVPTVTSNVAWLLRLADDTERADRSDRDPRAVAAELDELHDAMRAQTHDQPFLAGAAGTTGKVAYPMPYFMQSHLGVMCSETANPIDVSTAVSEAARQNDILPGIGRFRVWQGSPCSQWPLVAKNAYHGPFNTPSARGVLVVGNTLDPATPFELGTKKLAATLPGSRLVTVERGYGHFALAYSQCAKDTASEYLLTAELPAADVTCAPDEPLFSE